MWLGLALLTPGEGALVPSRPAGRGLGTWACWPWVVRDTACLFLGAREGAGDLSPRPGLCGGHRMLRLAWEMGSRMMFRMRSGPMGGVFVRMGVIVERVPQDSCSAPAFVKF